MNNGYYDVDKGGCPPIYKKIPRTPVVKTVEYKCENPEPECHDHKPKYCSDNAYSNGNGYSWGANSWGMFFIFFIFILIIIFAICWIAKPEFCQSIDNSGHPCGDVDICTAFVTAFIIAIILTAFVCLIATMMKKY